MLQSISDITKATGITKGAIYGNFKNKDEVAFAAYDKANEVVMGQFWSIIGKASTALAKLKAIVNYFAEYIENPPNCRRMPYNQHLSGGR